MSDLHIEYLDIEKLCHFGRNSKIHTKEQIRHIANSIQRFGFNDPIGIAGKDNTVLEGNGRVEAAKLLGMKTLPCIRLDHLSKDEQDAYVIAHNAVNLETGFDDGVLYEELKKLQDYDFRDFGLDPERFLQTLVRIQKRILRPVRRVHYLISADLEFNPQILEAMEKIRLLQGVEIESTFN